MNVPWRRVFSILGAAIVLAVVCRFAAIPATAPGGVAASAGSALAQNPSVQAALAASPRWAWFGVLAVAILWIISGLFADAWNPLALAMGVDNRLSTSKLQALLWTATVGFVYVMIYADRVLVYGFVNAITAIPENVLIALGISATSAVAAKAITTSQVAANPGSKTPNPTPSYNVSNLVTNDGAPTPSLTKVQYLFWTIVAIVVYLVTAFHGLGAAASCHTDKCSLPDIDTILMLFMGLGSATYAGVKLTNGSLPTSNPATPSSGAGAAAQPLPGSLPVSAPPLPATPAPNATTPPTVPSLASATATTNADGSQTVTLVGVGLGASGAVLMNGAPTTLGDLTWTNTVVTFTMPPKPGGGQWTSADGVSFALAVTGSTLGPVPCAC